MNTALCIDRHNEGAGALPLVCLHGWGMNLRVFDELRDALPGQESWAIDLPGHGRSQWLPQRADFASQVEDVLAALPPRCVLLGWSLGGKLALEIARRAPQVVRALVLVAVSPRFAQAPDWPQGMNGDAVQAFTRTLEQDWRQTLSDFVWLQIRGSRNAEATQRRVQAALDHHGAPRPEALRADMQLLATVDLRAIVPVIRQPSLLIAGQNDRVVPPDATRWLAQALPDARFHQIARAAHAPFLSHVEEVALLLRPFLAGHSRESGDFSA